jgi:outer membrane receptor protein involved in Fe transport
MPKNRPSRRPALSSMTLVASVVGAIALPSARADEAPTPDVANPAPAQPVARSDQMQSVTVTAQKRKEDASKVPISMSVLGGEELQAQHITDITDVTRAVPNVSFSSQGLGGAGPGLSNIEMRGVASSAGSNTTGIYLDDVSMTTRNIFSLGAAEPKFFDLERIEVLRGPQGTLYGAGSMGGTVKFISNQPDLRESTTNLTSEVSSTQGGGVNYQLTAVHNAPLIPGELAVRIGVLQGRTSGYIDQVDSSGHQVASNINWERDSVLRLGVKWRPTAQLNIAPSLFYQEVHTGDIDASYLDLAPNKTSKTVREPGVDKLTVPSVTVGYDFGQTNLTSVSSYFQRIFNRTQDGTAVNSEYIGSVLNGLPDSPVGLGDAVGVLPSAVLLNNRVFQFSQELRLASKDYAPDESPLTWIVGTYFSNLRTALYDNEPVYGITDTFASFGADPADPNLLGSATPNDMVYQSLRRYKTTQSALFGEAIYHFTPSFYGTVGARYIKSKDSLVQDLNYYFADGPQHIQREASGTAVTPKFALTWEVNHNQTVYANAAKGARLGSENRFIPTGVCGQDLKNQGLTDGVPPSYGPDSLWSYELGSKSKLLDNRLNVNLAAFYIDWKKLQQDVQLPICGFDYETNIGGAKSVGFEFEVKGKPNANLTLGVAGGYTKAEVTSDVALLNVKSGDPVAGVPRYNVSMTADYNFAISGAVSGFVRGSSAWVGASHGSLVKTDPDYSRPGYNTVNLSAGTNYDTWQISIFAKNLFNDQKVIQRPNVEFVNEGYRLRPRTVGISLSGSL